MNRLHLPESINQILFGRASTPTSRQTARPNVAPAPPPSRAPARFALPRSGVRGDHPNPLHPDVAPVPAPVRRAHGKPAPFHTLACTWGPIPVTCPACVCAPTRGPHHPEHHRHREKRGGGGRCPTGSGEEETLLPFTTPDLLLKHPNTTFATYV